METMLLVKKKLITFPYDSIVNSSVCAYFLCILIFYLCNYYTLTNFPLKNHPLNNLTKLFYLYCTKNTINLISVFQDLSEAKILKQVLINTIF